LKIKSSLMSNSLVWLNSTHDLEILLTTGTHKEIKKNSERLAYPIGTL